MEQKTAIIIGILVLSVGIIIAISIGVGLYFYFRRKKKNPFFGLQITGIPFKRVQAPGESPPPSDTMTLEAYKTLMASYISALTSNYGVSKLATKDQITKAVTVDRYASCFYGLADETELTNSTELYIAPYYASEAVFNTLCGANKNDIGKHVIYTCGVTSCYTEGFYMYVTDESKIPNNGDKVTLKLSDGTSVTFTVVANFTST